MSITDQISMLSKAHAMKYTFKYLNPDEENHTPTNKQLSDVYDAFVTLNSCVPQIADNIDFDYLLHDNLFLDLSSEDVIPYLESLREVYTDICIAARKLK